MNLHATPAAGATSPTKIVFTPVETPLARGDVKIEGEAVVLALAKA